MACIPKAALRLLLPAILAGCTGSNGSSGIKPVTGTAPDSAMNTASDTVSDTAPETAASSDSDSGEERKAPWADIIDVDMSGSENNYQLMATLHSTDIDCSEYANWIEVITDDGELVYRRILIHPHTPPLTGNPVTRGGGPVNVGADDVVIVRAHLNTAGYTGIAMRGSFNAGFAPAPEIAADFAADVESLAPQPGACTPEESIMSGK